MDNSLREIISRKTTALMLAGFAPAASGAVMGSLSGYCVYLLSQDTRQAAAWGLCLGWVAHLLTFGLLSDLAARPVIERAEPPAAPVDFTKLSDNPVLIPTQDDGRAGHAFRVTPWQWSQLAARVAVGQYALPINQLSLNGQPFAQDAIKQLRQDLIDAGMAYQTPTGRVYLNERGRVFVAMQPPRSKR